MTTQKERKPVASGLDEVDGAAAGADALEAASLRTEDMSSDEEEGGLAGPAGAAKGRGDSARAGHTAKIGPA